MELHNNYNELYTESEPISENIFRGWLSSDSRSQDYDIITDANSLYKAYLAMKKGSDWKSKVQRFECNFLTNIFAIQNKLINRTYKVSKGEEFLLRERGKNRWISSKSPEDRLVAHVLCDEVLEPVLRPKLIYDNCASLRGRGLHQQRERLKIHLMKYFKQYQTNDGYILLIDFTKFYDNIDHKKVYDYMSKYISNPLHLWLLQTFLDSFKIDISFMSEEPEVFNKLDYEKYIHNHPEVLTKEKFMNRSCNIGCQTSQIIGVFYPTVIDNYVKIVRGEKYYGRYMDDSYIISPSIYHLKELLAEITAIASDIGIHINKDKTQIYTLSKFKFLQIFYSLSPTGKVRIKINPKRIRDMKRKIKKLTKKGINCNNLFKSWFCGHVRYMSKNQRKNMAKFFMEINVQKTDKNTEKGTERSDKKS